MPLKNELCRAWKLYVITAPQADQAHLEKRVRQAVLGGADVVQLRDKDATDEDLLRQATSLVALTRTLGVPLIVNDRISVAKQAGADGVHLGQEDGPLSEAMRMLGSKAIFGRSTHSPEQALRAEREGFDYIGVGPVFATPTKAGRTPVGLELVRFASESIGLPFVAIGGIDTSNARSVRNAGARCIAVVRAVMDARDPQEAAVALKR